MSSSGQMPKISPTAVASPSAASIPLRFMPTGLQRRFATLSARGLRGRLLTAGLHLNVEVAAAVTAGEERRKQYQGSNLPRSRIQSYLHAPPALATVIAGLDPQCIFLRTRWNPRGEARG